MSTILPKVIEIERCQLADYARVDYAITKGEDEIATLEELRLRPSELRRKTSVVRVKSELLSGSRMSTDPCQFGTFLHLQEILIEPVSEAVKTCP
jgi:hypothetical protein